tara:strand:+ start:369 stop:881 length:513 start_codon:yes stop_codon:yes gene_type:complete
VTKRDILENQARLIYLGIGSNLGNKKSNIEKAKFKLLQSNIKILKSSSYYESLSWPNPNNPKFLNIVLKITSNLKPLNLLRTCKEIEISLGRKKTFKNSPRVCDIDVLDYDKKTISNGIILPHPRMHSRNFVLLPLYEIDKNWIHPTTKHHIKRLILSLSNKDITSIKQI